MNLFVGESNIWPYSTHDGTNGKRNFKTIGGNLSIRQTRRKT